MSYHEKGFKFAMSEIIGILEDKDGQSPVVGVLSNDKSLAKVLIEDIERETGTKSKPLEDFFDGQSKTFGFTNWRGSTWVPKGPKPNWTVPSKKLN